MNEQNDHLPAPGGHHEEPPANGSEIAYLPARTTREQPPGGRDRLDEVGRRAAVIVDLRRRRGAFDETIRQLRRRGVPGYSTDVIAATEPDRLIEAPYELIHLAAGEPAASEAIALAGARGIPIVAADAAPERGPHLRKCGLVLSPTRAADVALAELGVSRIARWQPAIDRELFGPARYSATVLPAAEDDERRPFHVLCTNQRADEGSLWLVVQAFLAARLRDRRLRLVLVGYGELPAGLRAALADAVQLLDGDDPDHLARVYASADLFVSSDTSDSFGIGVLEAQASGLPVLAIEGSGPGELVESGRSGCLVAPDPEALGAAIHGLARRATLRERLVTGGLLAARERTWGRSLIDLAVSWERAINLGSAEVTRAA